MNQRVIHLYDQYTHGPLDRRVFLARLARLVGGTAAALALLPQLEGSAARADIVPPDDPRLDTTRIGYPGHSGTIDSYLVSPKGAKSLPSVMVIHENRGLNAHIQDVTRRVALEGFLAMAPDLLSSSGGTPTSDDTARQMISELNPKETLQNVLDGIAFLRRHAQGNGRVGVMGFCWGGGIAGEVAVNAPSLDAAVVYYGRQPDATAVPKIKAPLLLHYAGLDARINEGIPVFQEALEKGHKNYALYIYEGANHAFNNDTSEVRYNKQAAELAWIRTVGFLKKNLKSQDKLVRPSARTDGIS